VCIPAQRTGAKHGDLDAVSFFVGAEVWDLEGRKIFSAPFLDVSRDQVVVVAPD
jgi:hypothetical protein